MIVGAHSIIYSKDADRDRAFLRDVLGLPSVDAGGGWLIFGLPPAEVAVHPGDENDVQELYLLTDDLSGLVEALQKRGITCAAPRVMSWGVLTQVTLPAGGKLGVYQPRHARPKPMGVRAKGRDAPTSAGKTARKGSSRGSVARRRTRR